MSQDYSYEKRRFVVGAVAAVIIAVYLIRLFTLQLMSDDYRKSADSNAFRKESSILLAVSSWTAMVNSSSITSLLTTSL